jgi:ATP-dependent helicase/nuclease subunit B
LIKNPSSSADALGDVAAHIDGTVFSGGGAVVTATRRLARRMRLEHAAAMTAASWPTPRVLPWSAWLGETYRDLRDFGALRSASSLLDEHQSAALWAGVFADDPAAAQLLMPGGAVEGFREAWRLVHEWRLSWREIEARASEDCRVFLRVARGYRAALDALGAIDADLLPAAVAAALAEPGSRDLRFAGFDRLSPAQRAIHEAPGVRARDLDPPSRGREATLAAHTDLRSEIEAAASWARARLEANPAARLGVVVPELEAAAGLVEDVFDEALAPARLLPGQGEAPRPWNMSLGRPLAQVPVVAAALRACGLLRERIDPREAGHFLRSPFLAESVSEGGPRARLDAWIREHAGGGLTADELLAWLGGRDQAPAAPRLGRGLRGLLDELRAGPRRRAPSAWAGALTRGLQHLGWPGDAALESADWQSVQAWADALATFARLDIVTGALSWPEASARLQQVCNERMFQPETPEAPVQVLGLLETAGLEFDGLWVAGMHDGVLPAPLRPCAMLPAALQREKTMPRACPGAELALAQRMVSRLVAAAPEVRFSYPLHREDEPLRPSPVVSHLPRNEATIERFPGVSAAIFAGRRLELISDPSGPPVAGGISGGTGLLATQAACPFKAFATHRLSARPLEEGGGGVDDRARGLFVHQALRDLWGTLGGRDGLASMDAGRLTMRVRAALETAAHSVLDGVAPGLVRIEVDEATRRIRELLSIELERPAFEVLSREVPLEIELGPLRLRGQVDRVDRVPGGLAIIDYKSGAASPADWDGERPLQPQLPLYAMAFPGEVVALVFASLKPGAVQLRGRARTAEAFGHTLPLQRGTSPGEWEDMLAAWRHSLEALAEAVAHGDARIDPVAVNGSRSPCPRCHLQVLCRRDELVRAGVLVDD